MDKIKRWTNGLVLEIQDYIETQRGFGFCRLTSIDEVTGLYVIVGVKDNSDGESYKLKLDFSATSIEVLNNEHR